MHKKKFKLDGKGCASCASKIEDKIKKINTVHTVVVNFLTGKMIVESTDELTDLEVDSMLRIISTYEPSIKVTVL